MDLTIDEAVELLESGSSVYVEVDGYEYEIADAVNFIGGEEFEGQYISVALGNIVYDGAHNVIEKTIEYFSVDDDGKNVDVVLHD